MDDLKDLATELGTPGFQKLYKAARKRNIDISKTEVKSFLAKQGQKQIFRPLPQSKGKTASEEPGYRAQMDLIDLKYSQIPRELSDSGRNRCIQQKSLCSTGIRENCWCRCVKTQTDIK